jgi:catechol 2,3-dioxygenase-like lactoylglutathione lyase family enzyme
MNQTRWQKRFGWRSTRAANPGTGALVKPQITVITLGVNDLEGALRFYRDGLGFPTEGIVGTEFEHGAVAFFDLPSGLKLALWPRRDIAWDAGIPKDAQSATELTIGHNVSSEKEVDAVVEQARKAGAKIIKEAQGTFWGGYAGYFQDPDGHLWEVVWNPQFEIPD